MSKLLRQFDRGPQFLFETLWKCICAILIIRYKCSLSLSLSLFLSLSLSFPLTKQTLNRDFICAALQLLGLSLNGNEYSWWKAKVVFVCVRGYVWMDCLHCTTVGLCSLYFLCLKKRFREEERLIEPKASKAIRREVQNRLKSYYGACQDLVAHSHSCLPLHDAPRHVSKLISEQSRPHQPRRSAFHLWGEVNGPEQERIYLRFRANDCVDDSIVLGR